MTLAEYETSLLTMPGKDRFIAAGPAYALRRELAEGEPFVAARDRVAAQRWYADDLARTGMTSTFGALTGP